jgi:hypothetical protein
MGKYTGVKQKFTKESFESLRKKKIETARYKKHKMLKKYEKLCIAEGMTSSSRVNLHAAPAEGEGEGEGDDCADADTPASAEAKTAAPEGKSEKVIVKKRQPFAKEMQIAAQRRSEFEEKRDAAGKREKDIDHLRKDRENKANRHKNRVKQGKLGLGRLASDLLGKIEKIKS